MSWRNLSFKYINPQAYQTVTEHLARTGGDQPGSYPQHYQGTDRQA